MTEIDPKYALQLSMQGRSPQEVISPDLVAVQARVQRHHEKHPRLEAEFYASRDKDIEKKEDEIKAIEQEIYNLESEIREKRRQFVDSITTYLEDGTLFKIFMDIFAEDDKVQILRQKFGENAIVHGQDLFRYLSEHVYEKVRDIKPESGTVGYVYKPYGGASDFQFNGSRSVEDIWLSFSHEKNNRPDRSSLIHGRRFSWARGNIEKSSFDLSSTEQIYSFYEAIFLGHAKPSGKHNFHQLESNVEDKKWEIEQKRKEISELRNERYRSYQSTFVAPDLRESPNARHQLEIEAKRRIIDLMFDRRIPRAQRVLSLEMFEHFFGENSQVIEFFREVERKSGKSLLRSFRRRRLKARVQREFSEGFRNSEEEKVISEFYDVWATALGMFLDNKKRITRINPDDPAEFMAAYVIEVLEKLEVLSRQLEIGLRVQSVGAVQMNFTEVIDSINVRMTDDMRFMAEASREVRLMLQNTPEAHQAALDDFDKRLAVAVTNGIPEEVGKRVDEALED